MRLTDPSSKIFSLVSLLAFRAEALAQGRRVVLTNGAFDVLHCGHLSYLHQSALLGDLLIVAVNSDASVRQLKGDGRPVNRELDRAIALAHMTCVDATFIFPGPRLTEEIITLKPDVYTKADDYTLETLDASERAALRIRIIRRHLRRWRSRHGRWPAATRLLPSAQHVWILQASVRFVCSPRGLA